ncbi:MAG TPA: hybrid sensor histidine kinase/response regulator [Candidatus Wallbacteria bacterium]|nr:hybrid sensor histidine kinase/response regulator [Candidatus Wallbacteria bacterium]
MFSTGMSGNESNIKAHILIVDDQQLNICCLKKIFEVEDTSWRISTATSGQQAMDIATSSPPDAILLDIMMPVMDGYQICRALKKEPKTSEIPVIFITAMKAVENLVAAFESGGSDYITKPFNSLEVVSRVKSHLELKFARDRLKKLSEWKDSLISIISHDLRGPINNLGLLTDVMETDIESLNLDPFYSSHLKQVRGALDDVKYLMNDLLSWAVSQPDAHSNKKNFITDARETIEECLKLFENEIKSKNISLESRLNENLSAKTDRFVIMTLMRNIISNSIKFTPSGGKITVTARSENGIVNIEVSDNGIGMNNETMSKLFTCGEKINARGVRDEKGAGVGLSICAELLERHGGTINAESEPDKGSKFMLTLPGAEK